MNTPQDVTDYPPMQGWQHPGSFDSRCRLWTVNEVPYGRFPTFADGGPATVCYGDWNVSYRTNDGKPTIKVFKVISQSPYQSERHPLDGTEYDTFDDAQRVAYEAGVIAYLVYVTDEEKYGL
jgi:hypothetical protein